LFGVLGDDVVREPVAIGKTKVSPGSLGLTKRQLKVLALLMQGKSNKVICHELDLAEPTVKYHVTAILKALEQSPIRLTIARICQVCGAFSSRVLD
jgi:DNA-binding NarL/FixJ family response regulator